MSKSFESQIEAVNSNEVYYSQDGMQTVSVRVIKIVMSNNQN